MLIMILFHEPYYRHLKHFYPEIVCKHRHSLHYSEFVELTLFNLSENEKMSEIFAVINIKDFLLEYYLHSFPTLEKDNIDYRL